MLAVDTRGHVLLLLVRTVGQNHPTTMKVAYIPEHFLTPLFFAKEQGFYEKHGVDVEFVPVIEGSGRLIKLLNSKEVDLAIGLTEAFVADIGKGNTDINIRATYVESPLCWAISTGAHRDEITTATDLKGKRIGISRIGSGSYVMSFVLGLQLEFPSPYFSEFPILNNFKNLRDSVNKKFVDDDGSQKDSDAFMWEHFTLKKYYDNGEIKKIGQIYTPWPSWVVTLHKDVATREISKFLAAVRDGIEYFAQNPDEAVQHISTHLDYSAEDAREWLKTVKFNEQIGQKQIDWATVVENTSKVLKTAGVLEDIASVDEALKLQVVSVLEE